jgi:hypothetical protein
MLAMLLPEQFGVLGGPSLTIFGLSPPMTIINICCKRAVSGHGPDNRRTNIIEGLLNYWYNDEPCRNLLIHCWRLMGRAFEYMDPFNKLRVKDMARNSFSMPDSIGNKIWWDRVNEARSYFQKVIWKLAAKASIPGVAYDVLHREMEEDARGHWYIVLLPHLMPPSVRLETLRHHGKHVGCLLQRPVIDGQRPVIDGIMSDVLRLIFDPFDC